MTIDPPPKAMAGSVVIGGFVALLLIAAGVVGIHDLVAELGWVEDGAWIAAALSEVDGTRVARWVVAAAVASFIVGLALLLVALKPRRRTHLAGTDDVIDLWVSRSALAALAVDSAERTPWVALASARTRSRRIDVEVRTADDEERVRQAVGAAVHARLDGLTELPVNVRCKELSQ